jgi:hypothetical protein
MMEKPAMSSLDSVNGPSLIDVLPALPKVMRAPFEKGDGFHLDGFERRRSVVMRALLWFTLPMTNCNSFVSGAWGRLGERVARVAGPRMAWSRIGVVCMAVSVGCGYTSQYSALQDQRARVVWRDGGPVPLLPAGSNACLGVTDESTNALQALGSVDPLWAAELSFVDGAWQSRRQRGRSHVPRKSAPAALPATAREATTPDTRDPRRPDAKDSDGDDDGDDKSILLAALAILVLPIFTAALLASDSVPAKPTAAAIDLVNTYNDLARTPGSACAPPSDVAEAR